MSTLYRNLAVGVLAAWVAATPILADEPTQPAAVPDDTGAKLVVEQEKVADAYARFKVSLLQLAEVMKQTDPSRASLLEKAVQQMNADGTDEKFDEVLKIFKQDALLVRSVDEALNQQQNIESQLVALLNLLLTENRAQRNESEKARIRRYLKDINRAIKQEKGLQGQTERGGDEIELAGRQGDLAK